MRYVLCLVLFASCIPGAWVRAEEASSAPAGGELFALCIGTHDAKKRSPARQAAMLKELGYSGMAHLWLKGLDERIKTLDAQGLKLVQVYLRLNLARATQPYDPKLPQALKRLAGRGVVLGLLVQGGKPSDAGRDKEIVSLLRALSDLARPHGVRLAMYPHVGDVVQTVGDAVRVARQVDRPNVGVMFNLCHHLKVRGETDLAAALKQAAPLLMAVTVNGADRPDAKRTMGWDRLIRPLGQGTFDVPGLLRLLRDIGYAGPVGLQCYGLRGDAKVHLAQSMAAWREYQKQLTRPKP